MLTSVLVSSHITRFRSNITDVTVIRSVSDAVEPASTKYCASARRCNGLLRRPEVLETVYSVEEDGDSDACCPGRPADQQSCHEADEEDNSEDQQHQQQQQQGPGCRGDGDSSLRPRLRELYGSFERLAQQQHELECGGANPEGPMTQAAPTSAPATMMSSAQRTRDESQQAQVRTREPGSLCWVERCTRLLFTIYCLRKKKKKIT